MTQFFTSDLHLGHARILELGSGRPFANIEEHNITIVNNWNEMVSTNDTVFLLGDIVMGEFEKNIKLIGLLNGEKLMVAGNHDRIFSGTNSKPRIERHLPLYEAVGLTVLPENTSIILNTSWGEQKVLLSHFPYTGDSHSEVDRFANHRFVSEGLPLVHGHTHSNSKLFEGNALEFHVGVDSHEFKPVHEGQVLEWLEGLRVAGLI
jgi:calcineurin-like phosphoesterase family protein